MQLGDCTTAELIERSPLDAALDTLDAALAEVIEKIDSGQLDQLDNTAKLALWHRFESIRNRLPLVDHGLIADAEATDLAGSYGFSSMSRFLTRILQLSPGEAAARVRAAGRSGSTQLHGGGEVGATAAQTGCPATRRCGEHREGSDCGAGHA
jgi:hypothetical protein